MWAGVTIGTFLWDRAGEVGEKMIEVMFEPGDTRFVPRYAWRQTRRSLEVHIV